MRPVWWHPHHRFVEPAHAIPGPFGARWKDATHRARTLQHSRLGARTVRMLAAMTESEMPTPTPEEIEAYLAEIRQVPADQLLLQPLQMLLGFAEAKLGQPDARPLIDAANAVVATSKDTLGPVAPQLQQMIGQLQIAQVQAETAARMQPASAEAGAGEATQGTTDSLESSDDAGANG